MNYVWMLLSIILGIVIYSLYKVGRINSRSENETFDTVLKKFIKKEAISVALSLTFGILVMMTVSAAFRMRADGVEIPGLPKWFNETWFYFVNLFMVFAGIVGSWVIISALNLTEKYIQKKADDTAKKLDVNLEDQTKA